MSRRRLPIEREAVFPGGDFDRGAIADVAGEDHLGERVLHAALDHALERPRAVGRIPALVGEPVPRLGVERFDANSYLYLTRAMDYFDIAADHDGVLAEAFRGISTRFCVVSFTSDWLFPTSEARAIVHALNASSARVSFSEIETDRGHDAFLLDVPEFFEISHAFLESAATVHGLNSVTR